MGIIAIYIKPSPPTSPILPPLPGRETATAPELDQWHSQWPHIIDIPNPNRSGPGTTTSSSQRNSPVSASSSRIHMEPPSSPPSSGSASRFGGGNDNKFLPFLPPNFESRISKLESSLKKLAKGLLLYLGVVDGKIGLKDDALEKGLFQVEELTRNTMLVTKMKKLGD